MTDKENRTIPAFENLVVFQKAYRLSLDVHRTSLGFPVIEQYALGDQIRKASKSICANIAEGFGKQRQSTAEFKRFLMVAMGSADEMRVWCRYCFDLGYIDEQTWISWRDSYHEIAKMLQGLHKKSGQKKSDP
jgi:four helix bundle protein